MTPSLSTLWSTRFVSGVPTTGTVNGLWGIFRRGTIDVSRPEEKSEVLQVWGRRDVATRGVLDSTVLERRLLSTLSTEYRIFLGSGGEVRHDVVWGRTSGTLDFDSVTVLMLTSTKLDPRLLRFLIRKNSSFSTRTLVFSDDSPSRLFRSRDPSIFPFVPTRYDRPVDPSCDFHNY